MVNIPQRFQVVNSLSAFGAGWRLLALMLCTPIGSLLAGYLVSRFKTPPFYLLIVAAILQTVGLILMGKLSESSTIVSASQYGYQVLLGLGIGLTLSTILIAAPIVIEDKDTGKFNGLPSRHPWRLILIAVFIGALAQMRLIGGSIGIAVCTNILNNKVRSASAILSQQQLRDLLRNAQTLESLPPTQQSTVRELFARGYNEETHVLIAFSGAALLATLMMSERKPRRMK